MPVADILKTPIAVLGAGSWGTALALLLAEKGQPVRLWGHRLEHVQAMQRDRCNRRYLPEIRFPENLSLFERLEDALRGVQDVLITIPSTHFVSALEQLKSFMSPQMRLLWGTKGLTPQKKFLHQAVSEVLGPRIQMAVISGPSFAKEVAQKRPTAVNLATLHTEFAQALLMRFSQDYFRIYTTDDINGVEICGVLKNILAIAAGIVDALQLGANAQSALITRGLAEIQRFGLAVGGKTETFYGLAGLGDLVLSCTDNQSRNRRFGHAMGLGQSAHTSLEAIAQAVEGYYNLPTIRDWAEGLNIDMPITEQVYQVVYAHKSPQLAIRDLLARATR